MGEACRPIRTTMGTIDFSIVITVFNEEKSIVTMLDTLINQSTSPKEIIVVDAGSNDDTTKLISEKIKLSPVPIRLFHKPGFNRSQGRNFGIEQSENEYIAVTDAGCEADKHWLEELATGFDDTHQAVAGYYLPIIDSPIQRIFAAYVATSPEAFNEQTYLPSSRSLAFSKQIWESVGKYPEHLCTCEDLVFAAALKKTGSMSVRRQALVYWHLADDIRAFFRQIMGYARGDVEAWYRPHLLSIASVWVRYILFLTFPPLFFIYLLYPIVKHRHVLKHNHEGLALPLVQVVCDWGILVGSLQGLFKRIGLI